MEYQRHLTPSHQFNMNFSMKLKHGDFLFHMELFIYQSRHHASGRETRSNTFSSNVTKADGAHMRRFPHFRKMAQRGTALWVETVRNRRVLFMDINLFPMSSRASG